MGAGGAGSFAGHGGPLPASAVPRPLPEGRPTRRRHSPQTADRARAVRPEPPAAVRRAFPETREARGGAAALCRAAGAHAARLRRRARLRIQRTARGRGTATSSGLTDALGAPRPDARQRSPTADGIGVTARPASARRRERVRRRRAVPRLILELGRGPGRLLPFGSELPTS